MRFLIGAALVGLYLFAGSIEVRDRENRVPTTQAEITALAGR